MEPDSKNIVETPDVIVVDCDDEATKPPDSNSKPHKKKREVTLCKVNNLETLCIKQNVHVENQKKKCVINFNTNICDNKREKLEPKHVKKSHRFKEISIERIVPKCDRPLCQAVIRDFLKTKKRCENISRSTRKHRSRNKTDKPKKHSSVSKQRKGKHEAPKKKKYKKVVRDPSLSLSSVSLSPFVSDITYEDISQDSFTCSDSEIDTLIRRAKERERRMCVTPELSFEKPLYASTPHKVIELSSDEETLKINESIHSIETFVLEPQLVAYSPIARTDNIPSRCIEDYEKDNFKNSLPTIDLTDTKFDSEPYYTKKSKCFVFNNHIETNFNDKNTLQHLDQSMITHEQFKTIELKTECFKTLLKSFKPTECKPNVAQLEKTVKDIKLPCSAMFSPEYNSSKEIKIGK